MPRRGGRAGLAPAAPCSRSSGCNAPEDHRHPRRALRHVSDSRARGRRTVEAGGLARRHTGGWFAKAAGRPVRLRSVVPRVGAPGEAEPAEPAEHVAAAFAHSVRLPEDFARDYTGPRHVVTANGPEPSSVLICSAHWSCRAARSLPFDLDPLRLSQCHLNREWLWHRRAVEIWTFYLADLTGSMFTCVIYSHLSVTNATEGTAMELFYRIYTAALLCAATAIILPAQTYTTLFNFGGTNGSFPGAALVQGTDGHLYGTTMGGGLNGSTEPCASLSGCGTIFKITPSGTLTTLYSFCAFSQCPDGAEPNAALIQTANGEFYGTTSGGGSASYCTSSAPYAPGCGTVFKITPSGSLTTIHTFCSQVACADGANPFAGLVQGSNGVLYGTTTSGGANNGGTIFEITPDGSFTTLYTFCSLSGCTDGGYPAWLVQAANGDLYGTTSQGGSSTYCASLSPFFSSCGTVFRITPSGTFKTLYSFCAQSGCTDGFSPQAGLVQATNGYFFGTTSYGGSATGACGSFGCGTVFKITSSGALTTLYSFTGRDDGGYPASGLIQATDGNLYGTNDFISPTIFKITPAGVLTTLSGLYQPPAFSGGYYPTPVEDTNGDLYGTTPLGTDLDFCFGGCGTVYSLSVGLGPFVKLQPASGEVGEAVEILGNDLTGATAVSFNGTPATFKAVSNTLIEANVPSGATTGKVRVTTPRGARVSDVGFRVRP